VYYLRFWLTFHFAETPVLGTPYPGPWFFDYVVAWLEFGPWFAWLAWDAWKCAHAGTDIGIHSEPIREETGTPHARQVMPESELHGEVTRALAEPIG
jgi:hypothetical protein